MSKDKAKKRQEEIDAHVKSGLKKFAKDNSILKNYSEQIVGSDVLVKICIIKAKVKSNIIIPGEVNNASEVYGATLLPVVKVIKVGDIPEDKKDRIVEGGVYLVPRQEVLGQGKNPEWVHFMQFKTEGEQRLKVTKDVKEYIPNLHLNWGKYAYSPLLNDSAEDDGQTYLIPWNKLKIKIA